jgi:hypothetical protein
VLHVFRPEAPGREGGGVHLLGGRAEAEGLTMMFYLIPLRLRLRLRKRASLTYC